MPSGSNSTASDTPTVRIYRGQPVAARQADRRLRFLEAGLEQFGTHGYAASSVTSICKAAGLSRRQFYEIFDDRESLLIALYDDIQGHARDAVAQALGTTTGSVEVLATAAMRAYMTSVGTDPRRAEVSFAQIVGVSPRVEQHRLDSRNEWMEFFVAGMAEFAASTPSPRLRHLATAFIGALTFVIHDWSQARDPAQIDDVVAVLADILVAFSAM